MHKLLQITLDKARQDEILISLMLTRKCPFECDHCFYGCSPRESGAYISDEVLSLVHDFYNELNTLEIKVRINLIGGEPTTNLSQFERVLSTGMEWEDFEGQPAKVEMVTNGWWLHRENSARRFFEIVKPYVMENDQYDPRFTISVSDDSYHRPFRPARFPAISSILRDLLDPEAIDPCYYNAPLFSKAIYRCGNCGEEFKHRRTICSSCGQREIYLDYESTVDLPASEGEIPWITTKSEDLDISGVIPSGVRGQWGLNDVARESHCSGFGHVTFDPKGKLTDGCCRGSDMPFGTVKDHPLVLMALIHEYQQHHAYSCRDCRVCAQYHAESGEFKSLKKALIRSIRQDDTIDWYTPRVKRKKYHLISLEEQSIKEAI